MAKTELTWDQWVSFGSFHEKEDSLGRIVRSFCHIGNAWVNVVVAPLTLSLPLGVFNESHPRCAKAAYKIRFRVPSLGKTKRDKVNAVLWNGLFLINFDSIILNPEQNVYEGVFYDFGKNENEGN